MKVLVFGGSGFIGSHVADALTVAGHDVTVFDLCHSPHLILNQKMVTGDILDFPLVKKSVENADIVFNFAAISDIETSNLNPLESVRQNILGNANILEACRLFPVKRFIFASSVYVHSDKGGFYGTSKLSSEKLIEQYTKSYLIPHTILRFGSVYGPRSNSHNRIHQMIRQVLVEKKVSLRGEGKEIRSFIFIRDAAALCVKILKSEFENKTITVSGNEKTSYLRVFEILKEMVGDQIKLERTDKKNPIRYQYTPFSLHTQNGIKLTQNPHVDLDQGIFLTLQQMAAEISPEKHPNISISSTQKDLQVHN